MKRQGFTLIELSITLVIIGLIVGGVLVGTDLIKAANLRSGISQIEKYNTAVNTFRLKYNGLPGDLKNASDFGLASSTYVLSGEVKYYDNGNGNGAILENHNYAGDFGINKSTSSSESWNFWKHLSSSKLVAGNFLGTSYGPSMSCNCILDESYTPRFSAFNKANLWPWYYQGSHYWTFLIKVPSPSNGHAFGWPFTPLLAQQIDLKVDDGLPNSGTVLATREGDQYASDENPQFNNPRTTADAGAAGCTLTTATPNVYNTQYTEQYCNLTIKAPF